VPFPAPTAHPKALEFTTFVKARQKSLEKRGDTLTKIEGLFNSQVTGVDIQKNRMGTVMYVRLPVSTFERYLQNTDITATTNTLLPTLVSILQLQDRDRYMIDVFLNIPDDSDLNDRIKQVSSYTERLETLGMPPYLVNAALKQGDENTVDLVFKRYIPFSVASTLSEEGLGGEQ
jgi:hypothetical protein